MITGDWTVNMKNVETEVEGAIFMRHGKTFSLDWPFHKEMVKHNVLEGKHKKMTDLRRFCLPRKTCFTLLSLINGLWITKFLPVPHLYKYGLHVM